MMSFLVNVIIASRLCLASKLAMVVSCNKCM